jgi:hypothetical protein
LVSESEKTLCANGSSFMKVTRSPARTSIFLGKNSLPRWLTTWSAAPTWVVSATTASTAPARIRVCMSNSFFLVFIPAGSTGAG